MPGQYQQILVAGDNISCLTFVELGYLYLVMSRLKAELVVHSLKMKENVPKQSVEIHTNKPVDIQSQR